MDEAGIKRILQAYGLPVGRLEPSPGSGVVNDVWLCGDYVVRVMKDEDYKSDLFTESVAGPAAFRAGVKTPEFLHWTLEEGPLGPPHSILRRSPGLPLALTKNLDYPCQVYRDLAAAIRVAHDRITEPPQPAEWLDEAWVVNLEELAARAEEARLGPEPLDLAENLAALGGAWTPTFVHKDLHRHNIMVHEGKFEAILDWGDAGMGDPACDLRYIPPRCMRAAWEGYGPDPDPGFRIRCCLHMVDQFVYSAVQGKGDYDILFGDGWEEVSAFCREVISAQF